MTWVLGEVEARDTGRRERMEILLIDGEDIRWERIALPARPVAPVRIMCDILAEEQGIVGA